MTDLNAQRLAWLHSAASNNVNDYEWGIYRVKWENGRAVEVWQTNADFSDLDAAANLAAPSPAPAVPSALPPYTFKRTENNGDVLVEEKEAEARVAAALAASRQSAATSEPETVIPEIDYDAAIAHAFKTMKIAQGTRGCVAFAKGAEWFRDQCLRAALAHQPAASQEGDGKPQSLGRAVADALRPYLGEGERVIWQEPFRWHDDSGLLPNHYEMFGLPSLAADFGYEVIHDCGCAGVIRDAARDGGAN